jgi:hypothetical protein
MFDALVEFAPVLFGNVAVMFTGVIVAAGEIFLLVVLGGVDAAPGYDSRFGDVLVTLLFPQGVFFGKVLALLIIFDAVLELLCLFPGFPDVHLLLRLEILELLAPELLVILAFFDDLIEMVLLIFA